ncbi:MULTISPECIES: NRDE family protein [unclassified Caballeronia]|uniref:NRDE family protein n=1 Tax=unclassified Caballeronia TaxID=2646786 RepID=UPI002862762D|nr:MULTISPECIES: NRDE family protein [unclassified Caballeronia]MDR5738403.1 NRDE family protein [Caballeronia sp. LZ016]MDR5811742.1 NRDE family protein [Caballeronia sp. LZ019]
MCLIVFDWQPDAQADARTPGERALLTLAANRDEFFRRDAEPMHWWTDTPGVLAGRDLTGGGTWLGVSRDGRFAALTNFRAPAEMRADAPTRGALVSAFLAGERVAPLDYLERVAARGHRYNGFNLLCGDFTRRELGWYGNRADAPPALLEAGVHGLSNSLLNTPWPKLVAQRDALADLIHADEHPALDVLIDTLRDPRIADDALLPSTGVSVERERVLSAAFIETPEYGTRSTTALRVTPTARGMSIRIKERSDDDGSHRIVRPGSFERAFEFDIDA